MELYNEIQIQIKEQLEQLSHFTSTPGNGVTRFPFTKEAKEACAYLVEIMMRIGLEVREDISGSIVGRLEGEVPETIMIGSHYDSVKNGGMYDGIAGVVTAIATVNQLIQNDIKPYYSIEVIATNDEEGSRFKSGLFTGKVLLGQMQVKNLKAYIDEDGISMYQAMKEYGLNPDKISSNIRSDIKAFIETHIEQGPVLENEKKEIGIVDIIVGIKRVIVTIAGRADHVGTMPMNMRKDAMEAAAKVISQIGDTARCYQDTVATVGNISIEPNIINIVPSKAVFSVDFRSTSQEIIDIQYQKLIQHLQEVTGRFNMKFTVETTLDVQPVTMNSGFKELLKKSCISRNISFCNLPSGAGHDAQVFGKEIPSCMVFVPSINGRSHCPEEKTDEYTLALASLVMYDLIVKICKERKL